MKERKELREDPSGKLKTFGYLHWCYGASSGASRGERGHDILHVFVYLERRFMD